MQYGEFRIKYAGAEEDSRLIFYGIRCAKPALIPRDYTLVDGEEQGVATQICGLPRYIIECYVAKQWTVEDVEKADAFFRQVGKLQMP